MKTAGFLFVVFFFFSAGFVFSQEEQPKQAEKETCRYVIFKTNLGDIILELFPENAPITVQNFVQYVRDGFYDGTIFHRVISSFVVQGGGYTLDFKKKSTRPPIKNESNNGLSNMRGTIAMARTMDPHSATSQFFINLVDNTRLDYANGKYGYTVFGKVIQGMDVVDKIAQIPTGARGQFRRDVPLKEAYIKKASCMEKPPKTKGKGTS